MHPVCKKYSQARFNVAVKLLSFIMACPAFFCNAVNHNYITGREAELHFDNV